MASGGQADRGVEVEAGGFREFLDTVNPNLHTVEGPDDRCSSGDLDGRGDGDGVVGGRRADVNAGRRRRGASWAGDGQVEVLPREAIVDIRGVGLGIVVLVGHYRVAIELLAAKVLQRAALESELVPELPHSRNQSFPLRKFLDTTRHNQ